MVSPKTTTLFILAIALLFLACISIPSFHLVPVPRYNPKGTQPLDENGMPMMNYDIDQYYHYNIFAFIFLGCSVCFFLWWLIRIVRPLFGRATKRANASRKYGNRGD